MSWKTDLMERMLLVDTFITNLWDYHDWMERLNAAYLKYGRPDFDDDNGWALVAYEVGMPLICLERIRQDMAIYDFEKPCPDWMFLANDERLSVYRQEYQALETILSSMGMFPVLTAKGVE